MGFLIHFVFFPDIFKFPENIDEFFLLDFADRHDQSVDYTYQLLTVMRGR